MARKCDICGKGPMFGNTISHAHNVSKRVFYPNVHKVRVVETDGSVVRKKVCTKCLKAGKVKKA
ncbi:50S ribosomal protein L28 [Deferribacteraceae bacterium V6Fe1]|jgi:large subunit ribosomal protein L28|uniref:50S ribosomal protein L28 n=1 Tax=Deferrivibrio essentukiensis TaxID=2880922 RepID=UPI001F625D4B|nr:50S ribosomal protein L28 [Deferrivibrio essentukiensis]MCB4205224.1 50S ribosomal protein L28 [Deferrivibrio essentukiensis]UOD35628.1 50S ribosomal protein L28 [Deferribacteraceae bacterium V6Fe1]